VVVIVLQMMMTGKFTVVETNHFRSRLFDFHSRLIDDANIVVFIL